MTTAPDVRVGRDGPVTSDTLVGTLTGDPVLKYGRTGMAFARFTLSVRPWVRRGEPKPAATYVEVTCFANLAEHVAESLHCGDRAVVVGKREAGQWVGRDGVERTTDKLVAHAVGAELRFTTATVHPYPSEQPGPSTTSAAPDPYEEPF